LKTGITLSIVLGSILLAPFAFGLEFGSKDILREKIINEELQCSEGKQLIIANSGTRVGCVTDRTFDRLITRGWGISVEDFLDSFPLPQQPIINSADAPTLVDTTTLVHTTVLKQTGELKLMMFSPSKELEGIIDDKFNSADHIGSFRVPLLTQYPEFNQDVASFSIPTTRTAINDAIQNNLDVVIYDNEKYNGNLSTPSEELIDPAKSTNDAIKLINDAGLISGVAPTSRILLEEYRGVEWSQVDLLVMQFQKGTTQKIIYNTNLVSDFVRQKEDTEIFLQVNPIFAEISVIGDRVEAVRDKIDGVAIICLDNQGCNANMFSSLLTELGR